MSAERNGAPNEAISQYQKLLAHNPDHIPSQYNVARLFIKQQDDSSAIPHLEIVTHLAPEFPPGFYNLAIAYLHLKEIDKAINALENALTIYPDYIEAHQLRGGIAFMQQQWELAHYHFDAMLASDPYHAAAHLNKGILLLQQQDHVNAETHLLQAIEFDPTLSEAYYHLGVIAQMRHENDSAMHYFENTFDRDPQHFGACYNLGLLYKEKNQLKIAQHYFATAKALRPDDPHAIFLDAALSQAHLPTRAPSTFVAELFDHYASYYDAHLNDTLQYQVPIALKNALEKQLRVHDNLDILDLGCGTGLSGLPFKSWAKALVGIDLAEKMLDVAKARHIYTELHQQDIFEYLQQYQTPFDLIIAADLLGYLGELNHFFALTAQHLKPNGFLIFSAEINDTQDYQLQTCARFSHSEKYLLELAQKNNLRLQFEEDIVLRHQENQPIQGKIFGFSL